MTIYDVLIADHREAVTLLKKAEKAEGKEQQQLLVTVIDALSAHADAEGEILYDNIADASDDLHDLIMEAHEEHLSAAHLMKELLDPTVTAERRTAKTTVLREQVEHHVEEEEGEMFTKARRVLDDNVADALAGEFIARKAALMSKPLAERVAAAIAKQEALARGVGPKKPAPGHNGVAQAR